MLLIVSASDEKYDFEVLAVVADQLQAIGLEPRIAMCGAVLELSRNAQFDLAPFMTDELAGPEDTVLLIGSNKITDAASIRLRAPLRHAGRVIAIGSFDTVQSRISVRAALSYLTKSRPEVLSVADDQGALPVFGVDCGEGMRRGSRKAVIIHDPEPGNPEDKALIDALFWSETLEPVILCHSAVKSEFTKNYGPALRCYHHYEIMPRHVTSLADMVIMRGEKANGYRNMALIANCLESGVPVMANRLKHSPNWIMRLPNSVDAALRMIDRDLVGNEEMIREELAAVKRPELDAGLLALLGQTRKVKKDTKRAGIIYMPTNGVGLGHAQRCSLVAAQMREQKPVFAAFPSCMRMLQGYGFDVMPLVSRSPHHGQEHDNDMINRARLDALSADGGTLVFDGGYVFDSILRVIADRRMNGIWIRRGMWQASQDNSIALDREKIFSKVIVPNEAFDELNESYSEGAHIHNVGPIVQQTNITPAKHTHLRSRLAAKYGEFDKLVVTMLGGGVAADRSIQMSVLANMFEERRSLLHLVVTWPTALVPPALAACSNTHVVRTHHASVLASVADLYISAVGYNSFHEAMYNRIPTIFMAQMNSFMDDQHKRASAAVNRGLADMVDPEDYSHLLGQISLHLDSGYGSDIRMALAEINLPLPGNADAARLILGGK